MNYRLEPLRDNLMLRLEPLPEQTGLIVRVQRDEIARWATVHAVGPEVRDVAAGQRVLINGLVGTEVGEELLVPESAVLGTE